MKFGRIFVVNESDYKINPLENIIKDCIVNIQVVDKPKTVYDHMRKAAEDVEFEEIKTVHENRETETTIQVIG